MLQPNANIIKIVLVIQLLIYTFVKTTTNTYAQLSKPS
jgi:hypothetical protein